MNNLYNEYQKEKRKLRDEIRTNLRLPNNMILKLKINSFEQRLRTNSYIIKLLQLALETVIIKENEILNFQNAEDYEDIKPLQVILPKEIVTNMKMIAIILEDREYYQNQILGVKTKGRSVIDLLYTGLMLDEQNK